MANSKFMELHHAIESQNIFLLTSLLSQEKYIVQLDWNEESFIRGCCEDDGEYYEPLLQQAVAIENLEIIKLFLKKGKYLPNFSICLGLSIEIAAKLNNIEIVKILIKAGADVNGKGEEPPIISASGAGNLQLVELLINLGVDVDHPADEGFTALMAASGRSSVEMVKLLLENGAKIDRTLVDGWTTALDFAHFKGNKEVYEYLKNEYFLRELPIPPDLP